MKTISVVTSVYNAGSTIERLFKSVLWADEIIVVDNRSQDDTYKIASKYATKIFQKPNNIMLNVNKNYGFKKASGDYILNLDADEEITDTLGKEIVSLLKSDNLRDGYWIARKNIIFGKWIKHGLWWPDKQLRLFKRGSGKFACKHVHEYIEVDGVTGDLENPFLHYNYETISQYICKLENIYTENEAANLLDTGYVPVWQDAIRFPLSDFLKIYFAQKGYRDGLHGLVLSLLQSFYSFIVFAKIWEKKHFFEKDIGLRQLQKEFVSSGKQIQYWKNTALSNESSSIFTRYYYKLIRKLFK